MRPNRRFSSAATIRQLGPFQLEAALQSAHTQRVLGAPVSPHAILALYDGLVALHPSLGARVSRAVAVATSQGAEAGLAALEALAPQAADYQPWWAARAELLSRSRNLPAARAAYDRAIGLAEDPAVRRFLAARRGALG